jgi:hypothetical protein
LECLLQKLLRKIPIRDSLSRGAGGIEPKIDF